MKRILFLLLMPFALCSYEKGLDLSLSLDPLNVEKGSRVDINYQAFFPFEGHMVVVNPRMCAYFDNHVDVSFGVGQRFLIGGNILGYHLFYDYSKHSPMYFHQGGSSLEFITSMFDYRVNYYHPFVKDKVLDFVSYQPHKWMEAEMSWKTDYFSAAIGPVYNFSTNSPAAKFRVSFPFKNLVFCAGVECDKNLDLRSFLSIGVHLYNFFDDAQNRPVCRTNRVQFASFEVPYIAPTLEEPEDHKHKKMEGAYYVALDPDYVLYTELTVYVKDNLYPTLVHSQSELEALREIYGDDIFVSVDQINIEHVTKTEDVVNDPFSPLEKSQEFAEDMQPNPSTSWWTWLFGE